MQLRSSHTLLLSLAIVSGCVSITRNAHADPIFGTNDPPADSVSDRGVDPAARRAKAEAFRPGFGARVGGYGFRNQEGGDIWDTCRMNGFGVFGTLDLNKYAFGELSLDFYSATPDTMNQGLDRTSTHALVGAGFRMLPDFVLTPHVVIGGGGEHTRVELPAGTIDAVYPMAYVGVGAELNITRELRLGSTLRMLGTTRPKLASASASGGIYGSSNEQALTGEASAKPEMQFDVAAQAQFFVRYAL
ncbi:MAG: outer membrane beta-barrel protein [Polyangiaceae bacterium]